MRKIIFEKHGTPSEVLKVVQFEKPVASASQVLIRVLARPVHPGDLLGVEGKYQSSEERNAPLPAGSGSVGFEGMGVIEKLGSSASTNGLRVGSRVAFFPVTGAWAEYVLAEAAYVVPVPDGVPDEISAQIHINPLTALMLFRAAEKASRQKDNFGTTVITAGASAVAKLLSSLALERGMHVVNIVRNSQAAIELRRLHGKPVIDSTATDWIEQLTEHTKGRPIRAVVDPVGGELASALIKQLALGGTMISYGNLSGTPFQVDSLLFPVRNIRIEGVSVGKWTQLPELVRADDSRRAMELAVKKPELFPVERHYDLEEVSEAVKHVSLAGRRGSIILTSLL